MANPAHFTILAFMLCLTLFMGCTANPQDLTQMPKAGGLGGAGGNSGASNQSAQTIILTMDEVAKHNSATDCWMVINGEVLDLTYFASHPGGATYVPYCGKDGTAAYSAIRGGNGHSTYATSMFADYLVGTLGQQMNSTVVSAVQNATQGAKSAKRQYYEDD